MFPDQNPLPPPDPLVYSKEIRDGNGKLIDIVTVADSEGTLDEPDNGSIVLQIVDAIFDEIMEKRGSAELLGMEKNNSKNASSDSLNSDSKSSSLNSKIGQESVR